MSKKHNKSDKPIIGPGLDLYSWNGGLLAKQGAIFGVRAGFVQNEKYVSGIHPYWLRWGSNYPITFFRYAQYLKGSSYDLASYVGPRAPDGSYSEMVIGPLQFKMCCLDENTLIASVTALQNKVECALEAYGPYDLCSADNSENSQFIEPLANPATFSVIENGKICGESVKVQWDGETIVPIGGIARIEGKAKKFLDKRKGLVHCVLAADPKPLGSYARTESDAVAMELENRGFGNGTKGNHCAYMRYSLSKGQSVVYTMRIGNKPITKLTVNRNAILKQLDAAGKKYEKKHVQGTGVLGGQVSAAINDVFWTQVYHPFIHSNFYSAGRAWMPICPLNIWGWDENFAALAGSLEDVAGAIQTVRFTYNDKRNGPLAAWKLYSKSTDVNFIKNCYPTYQTWYKDGKLEVGNSGIGMDDSPMNDFHEPQYAIDVNCFKALNLDIFSRIANVLGDTKASLQFKKWYDDLSLEINTKLWNNNRGLYLNRGVSGDWNTIDTPTSFYPLLAGVATPDRALRLVKHLEDPKAYGGKYPIPTINRSSALYQQILAAPEGTEEYPKFNYWRGEIWPMSSYLVYLGLKRYGMDKTSADIAAKSVKMWERAWKNHGKSPEHYHPETGEAGTLTMTKHQAFGSLMPLMAAEELIDVELWNTMGGLRFGTANCKEASSLHNILLNGHTYDVFITQKSLKVSCDKKPILQITGCAPVIRNFCYDQQECAFTIYASATAIIDVFWQKGKSRTTCKRGEHEIKVTSLQK